MKYCEFCGEGFHKNVTFYQVTLPVKDSSGDIPIVTFNICPHCYYKIGQVINNLRFEMAQCDTPEGLTRLKNRKPTSKADIRLTQSIIENLKYKDRYGLALVCGNNTYTIFSSNCLKNKDYKISESNNIILVNSYIRQDRQEYYWQRLIYSLVKELHKRNHINNYDKLISDYCHILNYL